jgi:hypothetical protein
MTASLRSPFLRFECADDIAVGGFGEVLGVIMGRSVGLPQCVPTTRRLVRLLLRSVDRALLGALPDVHYRRVGDDIAVGVRSEVQAAKVLRPPGGGEPARPEPAPGQGGRVACCRSRPAGDPAARPPLDIALPGPGQSGPEVAAMDDPGGHGPVLDQKGSRH